MDKLLSATEAARILGTNTRNVTRWAQAGLIGKQVGRTWVFRREELAAFERPKKGNPLFGPEFGNGKKPKKKRRR